MRDYLLFVDTETSGLPKNWNAPYSDNDSWPYIVQVAWTIYTKDGKEVKAENHFIGDHDFTITDESRQIHGIDRRFLDENGKSRKAVMELIFQDLQHYRPLVVGYFMELDAHMLSVGFHRAGTKNPLRELPSFCLMKATGSLVSYPYKKYLNLGELYKRLFGVPLSLQHDAMVDARATADSFFALHAKGLINNDTIMAQQMPVATQDMLRNDKITALMLFILVILALIMMIFYWL